jgi:hypothetical protein
MSDSAVVTVSALGRMKRFLGVFSGGSRLPISEQGVEVFVHSVKPDGTKELHRWIGDDDTDSWPPAGATKLFRVVTTAWPLDLTVCKALRTADDHFYDCRITGHWSVGDAQTFLAEYAADIVSTETPLSESVIQSWMASVAAPRVLDAAGQYAIEDLRDCDALPMAWWEKRLCDWLGKCGVAVKVTGVRWSSAEAEAAEADALRQKEMKRLAEARQRERELELQEALSRAKYEEEKARIQVDGTLSDQERLHALQLLEKRHKKENIEADTEIENARRAAERAVLEHDLAVARLKKDAEAVAHAGEKRREIEDRHQEVLRELGEMRITLDKLADLPGNLLAKLGETTGPAAHKTAERLTSPEFRIPAQSLARLGYDVSPQMFVQCIRELSPRLREAIQVRMVQLQTRDIGAAKVQALPLNASLQFELKANMSGHLTVINVGTSGGIYVHVPNLYVTPEKAKVEEGRSYAIPGSMLMPWEELRRCGMDYVEIGPPGWEHLVAIVSEAPLVEARCVARASLDNPFVRLSAHEFAHLCVNIMERSQHVRGVGILSFLVGNGESRFGPSTPFNETPTIVVSQPLDFRRIPAGTHIAGRYTIREKVGNGSFGSVYRATKESIMRDVALKFLDPRADIHVLSDPDHIREAILGAQLDHPNIVRVNDAGVEQGVPYIEMEFVKGESAAAMLERKGNFSPREALRIVMEALAGLEVGWGKGVIHRDVKPENLLLDADGRVKLADFGLAKWTGTGCESQKSISGVKGSPAYMAPELWKGKPPSVQTDVYALGLTLYALLVGQPAFRAASIGEVMQMHLNAAILWDGETVRQPQDIQALVEEMTAKQPVDRPQDAAALRQRLDALQSVC